MIFFSVLLLSDAILVSAETDHQQNRQSKPKQKRARQKCRTVRTCNKSIIVCGVYIRSNHADTPDQIKHDPADLCLRKMHFVQEPAANVPQMGGDDEKKFLLRAFQKHIAALPLSKV